MRRNLSLQWPLAQTGRASESDCHSAFRAHFVHCIFPSTQLTHRVLSTANWFSLFSWHIPLVLRPIDVFFQYVCMYGCFGIMCTCIYCVLYCLYRVFVLFHLCTFIRICFICTSVRTTATEWQIHGNHIRPIYGPSSDLHNKNTWYQLYNRPCTILQFISRLRTSI